MYVLAVLWEVTQTECFCTFLCAYMQVESLCEFPSSEFYNSKLKASPELKPRVDTGLDLFWPRGIACNI